MLFLIVAVATQLINVAVAWVATVTAWHTTNDIRIRLARHVLGLESQLPPPAHSGRTDPASRRRRDVCVRLHGSGHPPCRRRTAHDGRHDRRAGRRRLATGGRAPVYVVAAVAVIVRGRHRAVGESSDEMGSYARLYGGIEERLTAAEDLRSNGAGAHAMWRFVEESADAMGSAVRREKAFLRMWWAVDGSVGAGSVVSLVASAMLVSRDVISVGDAFLMFQYVLLLDATAGRHGRSAGDRPEGQRGDGPRHRPAGRRTRHPRRRHDAPARVAR